jgi:hypothetical protein
VVKGKESIKLTLLNRRLIDLRICACLVIPVHAIIEKRERKMRDISFLANGN